MNHRDMRDMQHQRGGNFSDDARTGGRFNTRPPGRAKHYRAAEGHEIALASMIAHDRFCQIDFTDGGSLMAKLKGFDRYTITVVKEDGLPKTFFKHAIKSFEEAVRSGQEDMDDGPAPGNQ